MQCPPEGSQTVIKPAAGAALPKPYCPGTAKRHFSVCFFEVLRVRDQSQSLLQALKLNFPSKMCDLDAHVSSYCIFRRLCRVWKVAKPFFLPCRSKGGCASSRLDHGFLNSSFGSAGTVSFRVPVGMLGCWDAWHAKKLFLGC